MSRVRFIQAELAAQKQESFRLVALSSPIGASKDVCEWLGVSHSKNCFNYAPSVREQCPSLGPLLVNI